jgi:hypothetical protein
MNRDDFVEPLPPSSSCGERVGGALYQLRKAIIEIEPADASAQRALYFRAQEQNLCGFDKTGDFVICDFVIEIGPGGKCHGFLIHEIAKSINLLIRFRLYRRNNDRD